MDALRAIRVFIAIAETGSLSAAGKRLSMPLATVSRHLSALEDKLGARLITRTTRRLALTESAVHYLEVCRQVLSQLEDAERRLAGEQAEPQGELGLTAPVLFGRMYVLPILVDFLESFPRVSARLSLTDRVVDLIDENLDIGVRIAPLPDSSLVGTRLGSIRHVTCACPAYLKRRGVPREPKELALHDCISFTALSPMEHWNYSGRRQGQRAILRPRLVVNSAEAAIDAAIGGLGITRVLSYQVAKHVAEGSLRLILEEFEPEELPVHILHRDDRLPRPKVQSFVAFAVPRLRTALKFQGHAQRKRGAAGRS